MSIEKGPASPNLPAEFPADIPVVGTSFIPWTAEDGGSGIQVADATESSFDEAVAKLTAAGYEQLDGDGKPGTEVRMGTFSNGTHQVSVVSANLGGHPQLSYTLTPAANL